MKITFRELCRKPGRILEAIERGERVTLFNRGREIAIIVSPKDAPRAFSVKETGVLGIWKDRPEMRNPQAYVAKMRGLRVFIAAVFFLGSSALAASPCAHVGIGPFAAKDGPQHQARIQESLDKGASAATVFQFAPGEYALTSAEGLRVPSGATLLMESARFVLAESIDRDGRRIRAALRILRESGRRLGQEHPWYMHLCCCVRKSSVL